MESHRDLERIPFSLYVVRSLLNVSQDSLVAMVPLAFNALLKNLTPILTKPPGRFVFIFQRVAVFVGNRVEAEYWLLEAPAKDVFFCPSGLSP